MAKKTKSIELVTRNINKKGKLKGKNKKETKMLVGICQHHKMTKKGGVKPFIYSPDGEYAVCRICGAKFPARFYQNDELGRIIGDMKALNNHNKFISAAINAGEHTTEFFSQFGVMIENYKKLSKKVKKVAEKTGEVKNKKKKNNFSGSSQYGSWGQK